MTRLFSLCGVGLCAVFAISVIRELHGGYVKWIVLAFTVVCLVFSVPSIQTAVSFIREVSNKSESGYIGTVLKALGVTYLTSTASDICKSCGEAGVGEHIETVGRIEILALTVPLLGDLLEMTLL